VLYCTTKLSCFKGLCNNPGASVPFSSKDFNYCHPMPSPTELLLLVRAHLPMLTCSSMVRGLQKCDRLVLLTIYNPYFLQIGDEDWIAKILPTHWNSSISIISSYLCKAISCFSLVVRFSISIGLWIRQISGSCLLFGNRSLKIS